VVAARILMRLFLATSLSLSLTILAACGSPPPAAAPVAPPPPAPAAPPAPKPEEPVSKEAMLEATIKREATGLTSTNVVSPNKNFTATVDSSAAPSFGATEGVERLVIPIGTDAPVSCIIRHDSPAPAELLYGVIANVQGAMKKSQIAQLDVGLVGRVPYLLAEVDYVVEQNGVPSLGAFKAAAFERDDGTLLCVHEELGYRATFRRVSEQFARTLVRQDLEPVPVPLEYTVSIAHIGKQAVGYMLERHLVRDDGAHLETESSSLLLPRAPSNLTSIASARISTSDRSGVILKVKSTSSRDAETVRDLALEKTKSGKYHVEGASGGKPVKADFVPRRPMWATWRERQELRTRMLGGPKVRTLTTSGYAASASATAATTTTWTATDRPMVVDSAAGEMKVRVTLDEQARPMSVTIPNPAADIVIDRALLETKAE
jgi:hypothetical protein